MKQFFTLDRVTEYSIVRAAAVLTGSYVASAWAPITPQCDGIGCYVKYTAGAVGGAWSMRVQWRVNTTGTPSTATVTQIMYSIGSDEITVAGAIIPGPVRADLIEDTDGFVLSDVMPGATDVRILISETGVPGTPGSAEVWLAARSRG